MAIVKSNLLKQLSDNYPNFLKKDLEKSLNIVLNEIKLALNKGENVELRDFGTWSVQTQKAKLSRNPKTGEKLETPEKKKIRFKMSKKLFKKINKKDFEYLINNEEMCKKIFCYFILSLIFLMNILNRHYLSLNFSHHSFRSFNSKVNNGYN